MTYTIRDQKRDSNRAIKESADRRHKRKLGVHCLCNKVTLRHLVLIPGVLITLGARAAYA